MPPGHERELLMSTATSAAGGSSRRASRRSGAPSLTVSIVIAIVGTAALFILGFLATLIFGNVLGTEFCPFTFERRGYAYREIPFTGISISTINRRTDIGIVELHITQKGYIVPDPSKTAPDDWHLLSLIRFRGTYAEGDAELLMKYLDAQDHAGEYAWLKWSEDHPQLAKILWPAVAKAAQENNYLIVPDLFSFARSTTNPAELQKSLDAALAKVAKPAAAKEDGTEKSAKKS